MYDSPNETVLSNNRRVPDVIVMQLFALHEDTIVQLCQTPHNNNTASSMLPVFAQWNKELIYIAVNNFASIMGLSGMTIRTKIQPAGKF